MEKIIRDFSKEASKEDRDSLAKEIRGRRKKHESVRNDYNELIDNIERTSKTTFNRLVNFSKIAKLRQEMGIKKDDLEKAQDDTKESRKLINDFYREQEEKWRTMPFDKEDIERYFNPDYLKGLSLEEYKKVLERFGGGMISHVTRQGVRDHADMGIMGHSGGEGKMHNGFKSIIQDGRLSYNLALSISESEGDKQIIDYLSIDKYDTKERALARLDGFTNEARQNAAGSFVDFHGPHFAVERVSDDFYGAETGNEIFFAFPSYMIAANYFHRNNPHIPVEATNYNDLWVYFKEDDEIDINSGLVFIPEGAEVNPQTGSVYETDENGEAKVDHVLFERLKSIVETPGFKDFAKYAADKLGKLIYSYKDYINNMLHSDRESERKAINIYEELEEKLTSMIPDINDKERLFVLDYYFLRFDMDSPDIGRSISGRMRDLRMLYIRAKDTISSKEYWEDYFNKNPRIKPNKIIFYNGDNPSQALKQWKCFSRVSDEKILHFDENRIFKNDHDLPDHILASIRNFKLRAERVIDDYFDKNKNT